jgi:multiple sugar transport system permease protein
MIMSAFKEDIEIFQGTGFFPTEWQFDNFTMGWSGVSGTEFGRFFLNSFLIVGVNIIANVISCSLTAYAFAKRAFRFKNFWFAIMLGTMMLPMHVTLLPSYVMFNWLDWLNTYLPLTVPNFFALQGFFVFMMTQFMRNIPKEIDEAAVIDGCNAWQHYTKVILPISIPAIITTCIFTFIWTWNDFFTQMIYITDVRRFPVSLALRQFVDATGNSSWGALFAMSTLSLVPLFLVFVFLQKYLIEGVTAGSVKG